MVKKTKRTDEADLAESQPKAIETADETPFTPQWGSLAPLPQEILDKIYAILFAAGDVAMTRVSKTYHENTKYALYRSGIYRLHIEPRLSQRRNNNRGVYITEVSPQFSATELPSVRSVRISVRNEAQEPFQRYAYSWRRAYRTTPEKHNRIFAGIMQSVPRCRDLRVDFQDVLMLDVAQEMKIGEWEFLKGLDTLTVSWKDGQNSVRCYRLDLRHRVEGLETIETVSGFQNLCNRDPRFGEIVVVPSVQETWGKILKSWAHAMRFG